MGSSQSSEAASIAPADRKPTVPRNKLTKPRTNTTSSAPSARSASSPRWSVASNSKPNLLVENAPQPSLERQSSTSSKIRQLKEHVPFIRRSSSLRAAIKRLRPSSIASEQAAVDDELRSESGKGSEAMSRSSTMHRSEMTRSEMHRSESLPTLSDYYPPSNVARRKSQLRAAPPATATRYATRRHTLAGDFCPPVFELSAEDERERCVTPSGYSVLGTFARGSLRVTNGAASPVPSTLSGGQESTRKVHGPGASTSSLLRHSSPAPRTPEAPRSMSMNAAIPQHEQRLRLVTSPAPSSNSSDELASPRSAYSFAPSPKLPPSPAESFPPQRQNTVISELSPPSTDESVQATQPDDTGSTQPRPNMRSTGHRHTKSGNTTDSGYSSTGSIPPPSPSPPLLHQQKPRQSQQQQQQQQQRHRQQQQQQQQQHPQHATPASPTSAVFTVPGVPARSSRRSSYTAYSVDAYRALVEPDQHALLGVRSADTLANAQPRSHAGARIYHYQPAPHPHYHHQHHYHYQQQYRQRSAVGGGGGGGVRHVSTGSIGSVVSAGGGSITGQDYYQRFARPVPLRRQHSMPVGGEGWM